MPDEIAQAGVTAVWKYARALEERVAKLAAAVREQSARSKGVKGRPQDGAREGYHPDSGQQDPLTAATPEGCNIIAGGLAPGEPCPEGCDICVDDRQPAVALPKPPEEK